MLTTALLLREDLFALPPSLALHSSGWLITSCVFCTSLSRQYMSAASIRAFFHELAVRFSHAVADRSPKGSHSILVAAVLISMN